MKKSFIENNQIDPHNLDPFLKECFYIQNKEEVLKKFNLYKNYPYTDTFLKNLAPIFLLSVSYYCFFKFSNPQGMALRIYLNKYSYFKLRNQILGGLTFASFLGAFHLHNKRMLEKNPYSLGLM
jgi:hypothetical protein